MAINKRSNSKFWYIQFQFNGKTYLRSSKTTDKRQAEQLETQWRKELFDQQMLGIKSPVPLAVAFQRYSDSKKAIASHPHLDRWAIRSAEYFKKLPYLHELRTADIEEFRLHLEGRQYSNQTIKHIMNIVSGTVKYAKKLGFRVPELEFPTIRLSKGRLRYLTLDEERRFLEAINPYRSVKGLAAFDDRTTLMQSQMIDVYDLAILLLDTGARFAEIAQMEWTQIDLSNRSIRLWRPKVRNESILFMTDRVYQVLSRRFAEKQTDYVFSNNAGGPRNITTHVFQRGFKRAGLPGCSAHTLRHTHATRLIQNGLNLYEVKEILGHADIKTTMRYSHIEQQSVSKKATALINIINKATEDLDN